MGDVADATSAPLPGLDLENPSAIMARSEALENQVISACESGLQDFLAQMRDATIAGDVSRGTVIGWWKAALTKSLSHPQFVNVRGDLLGELQSGSFADDAYEAAQMAISTCHNMGASPQERTDLITALFTVPPSEPTGLVSSLQDKLDGWLRRRLSKQITRGLAKGGSLENPTGFIKPAEDLTAPPSSASLVTPADWENDDRPGDINWQDRMARDIRTAYTSIFGRQMQYQIEKAGYGQKQWNSHHDDRTRHFHLLADGETVGTHETFIVGGEPLRYPGDPRGTPGNVINCRCSLSAVPGSQK